MLDQSDNQKLSDYHKHAKGIAPDQRVYSVNPSSKALLESLGVWKELEPKRIAPIEHLQIWESSGTSYMRWNEDASEPLGFVVEDKHLLAALHKCLEADGVVQREFSTKITRLNTKDTTYASGTLNDEVNFTAHLVVGCDMDSFVHRAMNIPIEEKESDYYKIACTVKAENKNDRTVWQRFMEAGPIAILPCWDGYSSAIWSCDKELHKYLMGLEPATFIDELNHNLTKKSKHETINVSLGGGEKFASPPKILEAVNERISYPVTKHQMERYIAHRLALLGEAAHSVHPLAGQSLNLGLMDVEVLTHVLNEQLHEKKDIGEETHLKEYETKAKLYNYLMMGGIELIMKGYENELLPFVQARNFALSALNNLGFAKKAFNEIANGKLYRDMIVNSSNEEFWKGMKVFRNLIKDDKFPQIFGGESK